MSWDDGMGMIARAEHELAQQALQDQYTPQEMTRMAGERGGLDAYRQEHLHREAVDRAMHDRHQRATPVSSGTPVPQSTLKPSDLPSFKDIVTSQKSEPASAPSGLADILISRSGSTTIPATSPSQFSVFKDIVIPVMICIIMSGIIGGLALLVYTVAHPYAVQHLP